MENYYFLRCLVFVGFDQLFGNLKRNFLLSWNGELSLSRATRNRIEV